MTLPTSGPTTVLAIATMACVVVNVFIVIADFAKARFVLANSAEVGLRPETLPYLATLKLAGVVGVVLGFAGVAWLGLAAAVGLVLFFICAVAAHVRAKVFGNIAFPCFYLLLAIAAVAYFASAVGA